MKIVDGHLDVADLYRFFKYPLKEFFQPQSPAPVTLKKLQQTHIDIAFFTLYFDKEFVRTSFYDGAKQYLTFYHRLFNRTSRLKLIKTKQDLLTKKDNQIGVVLSIEGFECFRSPADFEEFYRLGVRCFGPTWCFKNHYACGRHTKKDTGLSPHGKQLLKRMNSYRLMIDIAHLSENSVKDLAHVFDGTIVCSHANIRAVHPTRHNLTDFEVNLIVQRQGIVSLFPLSADVGPQGTFSELYQHLLYLLKNWGDDFIGLSSDIYPLPEYPFCHHHTDVSVLKHLADFFKTTPLSSSQLQKILFKNWYRVLLHALP